MTSPRESLLANLIRRTMDAVSNVLFAVAPGTAGRWDAWCDNHGRWDKFRARKESWET